jgi:hypothetical protein
VRITLGKLRSLIAEAVKGGSYPSEAYDKELADDPALARDSVMVPDDIKGHISKWMKDMGLAGNKKRSSTAR